MTHSPVVLVVEDEPDIRRFLRALLAADGYRVVESTSGRRGAIDAGTHKPDLAIIDLGLPDIDGIEVIRRIREWSSMPLLVLSARQQEDAKVRALDAGADDYVTKPFGAAELTARMRAAMRHSARAASPDGRLRLGDVEVDLHRRAARRAGEDVRLTPIEFRLLARLARSVGLVVTHRQLLTDVWGPAQAGQTHYLRIYMKQLRDKLERDPLRPEHFITEPGVGYRLVADA